MSTFLNQALDRLNADPAIRELLSDLYCLRAPDGSKIQFNLKKGDRLYRYFTDKRGNMYCFTQHADTNGRFWCWVYVVKKGHKGKQIWTLTELAQRANRAAARRDALQRYMESMK